MLPIAQEYAALMRRFQQDTFADPANSRDAGGGVQTGAGARELLP